MLPDNTPPSLCPRSRHPLGAAEGLQDPGLPQHAFDRGDRALAVTAAFDATESSNVRRDGWLIWCFSGRFSHDPIRLQPRQNVLEQAPVVGLGEQAQWTGLEEVRSAKEREPAGPVMPSDCDG